MPLPGLQRGLMLMQTQARFSSLELGANSTGTSTLDPSVICNPTAKVGNSHRHVGQVTHTCARTHIHTLKWTYILTFLTKLDTGYVFSGYWRYCSPKNPMEHIKHQTVGKEMKKEINACETVNRTPPA